MPIPDEPITRREQFYSSILGDGTPPDPITREEMYLYEIAQNGGGGGGGGTAGVTSVNGHTGTVVLTKSDINLGNVDNTSDTDKPVSAATQTALTLLSNHVDEIEQEIVNPDWNATSGRAKILNKPHTLAGYGISDAYTKLQGLDSSVTTKLLTIRVATISDQINVEMHTVNLTNTDKYPFNNSAQTVALAELRNNLDYSVEAEVLSRTGGVESVEVYDKQLNGFKVKFNGSGSAASVRLKITGGIT